MRPWQLICLRVIVFVLGPLPGGPWLIRRLLLLMIRKRGKVTYVAHADFLDLRALHPAREAVSLRKTDGNE